MELLSHSDVFRALLSRAADEGRGGALFGDSLARARDVAPPFLVGRRFPGVYLEHPLIGEPFLDLDMPLGAIEPGTRIDSPLAGDHGAMVDWYAAAQVENEGITCGFAIDAGKDPVPVAGVYFQPREHAELVEPFCEAAGEPERAALYLDLAQMMPGGWPLSYVGMFRGRPGSPLRVGGYLDDGELRACSDDPSRLAAVFGKVGFTAYDERMLSQASELMKAAPASVGFQFDIFPDGRLSPVFALEIGFDVERPKAVYETFENGSGARVMGLLQGWGAADDRWKAAIRSAFARVLPVELEDGRVGRYALLLMPQWMKARWINCELQPSKLYNFMTAGVFEGTGRPRTSDVEDAETFLIG